MAEQPAERASRHHGRPAAQPAARWPAQSSVDAVIFDWGGTLTPWHDVDFEAESRALAQPAVGGADSVAELLRKAGEAVWCRSRDAHTSARLADLFVEAGVTHDEALLTVGHTLGSPDATVEHLAEVYDVVAEWRTAADRDG